MTIELRQLRYFLAVAEEMHFGRAAKKLHMTQPPLSQAIQILEANLGAPLFTRSTRSIALTSAGLALIPEASRLLAQADSLPRLVQRAASGETGHLSLAFVSIADYSVLPPYLRQFRQHHHEVSIELREATSDLQLSLLENSEIDAGLLIPPIPDKLSEILEYQKVLSEPLILALPEAYTKRKNPGSLITYKDLPLIIFPRKIAPALYDTIFACFREAGITPEISQEAIQMQTIIGLVSAGMGIALVPQSVSNLKRPGVVYQVLPELNATVEIGIAWRRENTSPVLKTFLALLQIKPHSPKIRKIY
ncbi:MAG: LysR family transcriptional regulator [Undibacterium sp.]|nr:LysR family transcriptional regulator [Undibacterium sp.]